MEIVETVASSNEVIDPSQSDSSSNFSENILGEVVPTEEPVEGSAPAQDVEPEGGVEIPPEETTEEPAQETEPETPAQAGAQASVKPKTQAKADGSFSVNKAEYDKQMEELKFYNEKIKPLIPHWERFAKDPQEFVKDLGFEIKTNEKTYDQEYEEEVEKFRTSFGEDFEFVAGDLANPRSDSAKYSKGIGDIQFKLQQKHASNGSKLGATVLSNEEVWVKGNQMLSETVAEATKQFGIKQEDVLPAYQDIMKHIGNAGSDKEKIILLANLATKYYIQSKHGLKSKAVVHKIEEELAADARKTGIPTPTGQKSQNRPRTKTFNPFGGEGSDQMFSGL